MAGFMLLAVTGCSSITRIFKDDRPTFSHTVQPGETLFALSQRYGVSIGEIHDYNDVDAHALQIGQILKIPKSRYRDYQLIPEQSGATRASFANFSNSDVKKRLVKPLLWPVNTKEIMSRFGERSGNFHEGIDLRAQIGAPVYAAHDGEVAYSGEGLSGYGNLLVLKGPGFFTVYAHNSQLLVSRGAKVLRGDEVARAGQSGKASAPHLHFELRMRTNDGRYQAIDPMPFMGKRG